MDLDEILRELWEAARAAWPDVEIDEGAFGR